MSNENRTAILGVVVLYITLFILCLSVLSFTKSHGKSETTEPIDIMKESSTEPKSDVLGSFTSRTTESTPITTTPVTEPNLPHTEVLEYVTYFDVPLNEDLQDHIFAVCNWYDIDPALVIAVIEKESDFRPKLMGDNGAAYGLMQVQLKWHKDRMISLGYSDLLDPYANITVGVDYLAELFERGKPVEWVLMAYNGGPSYANRKYNAGEVSDYARKVLENSTKYSVRMAIKK